MIGKKRKFNREEEDDILTIKKMKSKVTTIIQCKYPDCESRKFHADSLCKKHYEKLRMEVMAIKKPTCKLPNCLRKNSGRRGLCRFHYNVYLENRRQTREATSRSTLATSFINMGDPILINGWTKKRREDGVS